MLCLGRLGRDIVDASGNDTPVLPSSDKVKLYHPILISYILNCSAWLRLKLNTKMASTTTPHYTTPHYTTPPGTFRPLLDKLGS